MSGRHSLQAEYTKHNERDANTNTETNMPVRIRSFVVCSRARPTTRARHTESELSRKIEIVGWKRERKEKIGASTRARTKKYSRCVRAYVRAYVRASCVRAWCVRACVRTCVRACVVRACRICIMCTYCVCICTCRKEKLHAAPYPSLSGSYRGYTIIMRTLSFFVSTRCLCFSFCICKRLPVFNWSESVFFVSIAHSHKQTHIPTVVYSCIHRETKQNSFVVSFGRRRARNIHTFFSKYWIFLALWHFRILLMLRQSTVSTHTSSIYSKNPDFPGCDE